MINLTANDLHKLQLELWERREELIDSQQSVYMELGSLQMDKAILESDFIQEIGLSLQEYEQKLHSIESEMINCDEKIAEIKNNKHEINLRIKEILDLLSQKIIEDVTL